jgi:hypothetical protein
LLRARRTWYDMARMTREKEQLPPDDYIRCAQWLVQNAYRHFQKAISGETLPRLPSQYTFYNDWTKNRVGSSASEIRNPIKSPGNADFSPTMRQGICEQSLGRLQEERRPSLRSGNGLGKMHHFPLVQGRNLCPRWTEVCRDALRWQYACGRTRGGL